MNSEVENLLKMLKDGLTGNFPSIQGIILFGSYATGNPDEKSDVDIAIISDGMEEEITTYVESHKKGLLNQVDFWVVPKSVMKDSVRLHEYRYAVNLLQNGFVLYDNGEMQRLRDELSNTSPNSETEDLYEKRAAEYSFMVDRYIFHAMRSIYQGSLNAVFFYLSRKYIVVNPRNILDVMKYD